MMMCNLFFIFDPSLSLFSLSWTVLVSFLVLPSIFYISSSVSYLNNLFFTFMSKEISFSIPKLHKGTNPFMTSLFLMVLLFNLLALYPHIFSSTSHLLTTFPLSYTMWLGVILFNLSAFFKHFLSHFIPLGTPDLLMSFMVVVEILSNLIRPLALTFRLTANMMAGHLLMSLVCGMMIPLKFTLSLMGIFLQFFLVFMEMGVGVIQAYVFLTLLLLYASEGGS